MKRKAMVSFKELKGGSFFPDFVIALTKLFSARFHRF